MGAKKRPILRTVEKIKPPYPLNKFPKGFAEKLGEEVVYLMATKQTPELEGREWEQIFANCIGAEWKPSNVGLDDIVLDNCAWGAKTVKQKSPRDCRKVRLISGRNSPIYSFGENRIRSSADYPNETGGMILDIWNERVAAIRRTNHNLRTVVLMKSDDLTELGIFEFDTIRYDPELYYWRWNQRKNLEGFARNDKAHKFTWQPHGSQFTIIEMVPSDVLVIQIRKPERLDKGEVLKNIKYDSSWVKILKGNG